METNIKIAVIGGTGKAGKYLIKQFAVKGLAFKVLLRDSSNFEDYGVNPEIIQGNVDNYHSVIELLTGCDVVISMLGMGVSPNPTNIFSTATTNIIRAMKQLSISRYIVITGLNVDTPFDDKSEAIKAATAWMLTHYPETTRDKQLEYEILTKSTIDWTLIRLPMIAQTDDNPQINISLEDCPGDGISATALANFIINQINSYTYKRKAPFIANI